MTIRILLVDDQELVRAGFRMVLDAQPDMAVVGAAGDGAAAITMLRTVSADVAVMDVRMPRLDGIEATRQICQAGSRPRVLMLTTFDLDEYAYAALKAGASGFLLKDVPPEELLFGIRAVHSGDAVVAPSTTRRLIDRFAPLSRVPENTMKFSVGIMLTSFGVFWGAEGAGVSWPGNDAALLAIIPATVLVALGYVGLLRRVHAAAAEASTDAVPVEGSTA